MFQRGPSVIDETTDAFFTFRRRVPDVDFHPATEKMSCPRGTDGAGAYDRDTTNIFWIRELHDQSGLNIERMDVPWPRRIADGAPSILTEPAPLSGSDR
jgi:hypothetical protein